MSLTTVFKTTRPAFLLLSPICVLLGISTALSSGAHFHFWTVALILLAAIFAHISVNMLNEYHDFKSGLDFITDKTKFSGGSGALPQNPAMARVVLLLAWIFLSATAIIGIYFVLQFSPQVLPMGLLGLVLIVAYTQWLNRVPWLCLIAPGLGFGVVMVVGTHAVIAAEYTPQAWLLSLVVFLLVNNLLLLNQFPDIKADANVGRKTLPIVYGVNTSVRVYASFAIVAYGLIFLMILKSSLPFLSVLAISPAVGSAFAYWGAKQHALALGQHPQYLVANVLAALLTPLLLAFSILMG